MVSGSFAFSARASVSASMVFRSEKAATCPSACTPASVRPAPVTATSRSSNECSASSSTPWIDSPEG
jgi:hypothetical protein